MADTTHLVLPLLAAAQAQKHVTHNEALLRLDALVQMAVIDRDLTEPPANPSDGDRYIPASGATGAWQGWDLNVAWFVDGVWTKLAPREGWRLWVDDEDLLLVWDGAAWQELQGGGGVSIRSYFHVHKNGTAQTGLASGDHHKLTWATEVLDEDGTFDLANDRWAPGAGLILMLAMAGTNVNLDQGRYQLRLAKNGILTNTIGDIRASGAAASLIIAPFFDLAEEGDYYELHYRALDGDGNTKTVSGDPGSTYWKGFKL